MVGLSPTKLKGIKRGMPRALPLRAAAATGPLTLGGILKESFKVVLVRNTFPAFSNEGMPSTPRDNQST